MKLLPFLFLLLPSLACAFGSAPTQVLKDDVFYEFDLDMTINGQTYHGVGVVPPAEKYSVHGKGYGKMGLVTFDSCHQTQKNNPGPIAVKDSGFDYTWEPGSLVTQGACDVHIGGYDLKGQHSWGYFMVANPFFQLEAFTKCNGFGSRNKGAVAGSSVCQSRAGLVQLIEFDEPVSVSPDDNCSLPPAKDDGKRFEFPIRYKECDYVFQGKTSKKFHRLHTIGFKQNLYRE